MQDSIRLAKCLLRGEVYLGPALAAMQGVSRHQFFLPTAVQVLERFDGPIRILEVGSWAGASTITWAKAFIELGRSVTVECVDQWQPYFDLSRETSPSYQQMNEAAASREIYALFQHNLRAAGIDRYVTVRRGSSSEVLPELSKRSYHLIYIDGSHLYPDVVTDIREAKRLILDGGVICGDDLEIQANEMTSQELMLAVESGLDSVKLGGGDQFFHPGVTAAVAEALGQVSAWDGYWAIRWEAAGAKSISLDLSGAKLPEHIQKEQEEILRIDGLVSKYIGEFNQFNLISFKRQFFGIPQFFGRIDLADLRESELDDLKKNGMCIEADSLADIKDKIRNLEGGSNEFEGFNLVYFKRHVFGIRQSFGAVNLADLGELELEDMKKNGVCVTGRTITDIKNKILNLEGGIGEFEGFNLMYFNNQVFGIRQSFGAVNLADLSGLELEDMKSNGMCVTGRTFTDIKNKILNLEGSIGEFEGFNLTFLKSPYQIFAIRQSVGPVSLQDINQFDLEDMEREGLCITGKTLTEIKNKILNLEGGIGEFEGFNLIYTNSSRKILAVSQSVGSVDVAGLSQSGLQDMEVRGLCVSGSRRAEVKLKILQIAHGILRPVGEFEGFNIVAFKHKFFGIRQSFGSVSFAELDESEIDEMKRDGMCVSGETIEEVKFKIINDKAGKFRWLMIVQSIFDKIAAAVSFTPKLIAKFEGFNLFIYKARFFGIRETSSFIPPAKLDASDLDNMMARGECVVGKSRLEVKREILRLEEGFPRLIAEFEGFKLVSLKRKFFAMHKDLWPINFADLDETMFESLKNSGQCLTGESIFEIKLNIISKLVAQPN